MGEIGVYNGFNHFQQQCVIMYSIKYQHRSIEKTCLLNNLVFYEEQCSLS